MKISDQSVTDYIDTKIPISSPFEKSKKAANKIKLPKFNVTSTGQYGTLINSTAVYSDAGGPEEEDASKRTSMVHRN